jgi:multiple sugar transport system permease protein
MSAGAPPQAGPISTGAASPPLPQLMRTRRGWPRPQLSWVKHVLFLLVLTLLSVLFIYPFVWLVSASLKPSAEVFDNALIPHTFSWPYDKQTTDPRGIFSTGPEGIGAPVARWMFNSIWIGVLASVLTVLSSAVVAFSFAYFRFPGRNFLFGLILATMMLPTMVLMIPTFLLWNRVGNWTETHTLFSIAGHDFPPRIGTRTQYPLWVGNMFGSAFYIFLLRQFFLGIPRDLFEAARVDGDSYFSMFRRIAMPLALPALVVVFIFEFQAKWFDLMTPLIYLAGTDAELFTMPLGLKTILDSFGLGGGGEGEWHIILAGTVLTVVPMIILFAIFQRYFVEGIATQGRKG